MSSDWLWALDSLQPDHVEPDAYIAAVRLRLGATFASAPTTCCVCRGVLDTQGILDTCCAQGTSTRGHNDVCDAVFALVRAADHNAEKEFLGLLVCDVRHLLPSRRANHVKNERQLVDEVFPWAGRAV